VSALIPQLLAAWDDRPEDLQITERTVAPELADAFLEEPEEAGRTKSVVRLRCHCCWGAGMVGRSRCPECLGLGDILVPMELFAPYARLVEGADHE
jgi:hypothetical protein